MIQEQLSIIGPYTVDMPDMFIAIRDYIVQWALPSLTADRIFRGWRHNDALPEDGADFAVITILTDKRRGTNVSSFTTDAATRDDGTLTRSKLVICDILVEFYGRADASRHRASAVEMLLRDEIASRFFEGCGITPLYADETREVTPDEWREKIPARYATTLHVSYWIRLTAAADWFDNANVHLLVEADTHYPTED